MPHHDHRPEDRPSNYIKAHRPHPVFKIFRKMRHARQEFDGVVKQ